MSTCHCDKLCSNACCVPLWITLDRLAKNKLSSGHNEHGVQFVSFGDGHACTDDRMVRPYNDVHDPAKLAELGAMALRARGFIVELLSDYYPRDQMSYGVVITWTNTSVDVRFDEWQNMTLPQFRSILARVMATPADESSREQCEKLIRGEQ